MRLSRLSSCLLSWFSCFLDFFCNITFVERFSPFLFFLVKCQSSFTLPPYVIWFWQNFWFSQLFINWFKIKFLCFSILNCHSVIWRDFILFSIMCDFMTSFWCFYFSLSDFLDFFSFHNNKLTIFWIWWNNVQ
jgi:hypothetical protein